MIFQLQFFIFSFYGISILAFLGKLLIKSSIKPVAYRFSTFFIKNEINFAVFCKYNLTFFKIFLLNENISVKFPNKCGKFYQKEMKVSIIKKFGIFLIFRFFSTIFNSLLLLNLFILEAILYC